MIRPLVLTIALLLTACAPAIQVQTYEARTPIRVSAPTKIIGLNRIVATIPAGTAVGSVQGGLACVTHRRLLWQALTPFVESSLADRFDREVGAAGYRHVRIVPPVQQGATPDVLFGDRKKLIEEAEAKADYLVAAVIRTAAWNQCFPFSGFGNTDDSKGEGSMEVEWKIYDRAGQRIAAEVTTSGASKMESATKEGRYLVHEAFAAAVRSFLAGQQLGNLVGR